jgi:NADP-dependent 3-hydroxy acid dehydrogenase YdfG
VRQVFDRGAAKSVVPKTADRRAGMDLGISGKVALVTGGSNGIGRAISEELGRNGCRVVVVARGRMEIYY